MAFIFQLPEPMLGQTHVDWYDITVTPGSGVRLIGTLGTLDAQGEFQPAPLLPAGLLVRGIAGEEYQAFLAFVDSQRPGSHAEGTGNFRGEDLAYWLTTYGVVGTTWGGVVVDAP